MHVFGGVNTCPFFMPLFIASSSVFIIIGRAQPARATENEKVRPIPTFLVAEFRTEAGGFLRLFFPACGSVSDPNRLGTGNVATVRSGAQTG